jgi:hypothetical protein
MITAGRRVTKARIVPGRMILMGMIGTADNVFHRRQLAHSQVLIIARLLVRADVMGNSSRMIASKPQPTSASWRTDIDSLAFRPDGHGGVCMVHRRAFRTLLKRAPTPEDCVAFFRAHEAGFQAAARAKILRANLEQAANLHLTSRDVARQMPN